MSLNDEVEEEIPIYLGRPKQQELQVWNFATRIRGRKYNAPEAITYTQDKEFLYFKTQNIQSAQNNVQSLDDVLEYTGSLQRQAMHCVYGVLMPTEVQDTSVPGLSKKSYVLLPINKFYRITPSVEAGEDLRRFQQHFQLDGVTYLPFQRPDKHDEQTTGNLNTEQSEMKSMKKHEKTPETHLEISTGIRNDKKTLDMQNQYGLTSFRHISGHISIEELLDDENYMQKLKVSKNESTIAPDKYNRLILQTQRIMKPNSKESLENLIGRLLASKSIISLQTLFSFARQHYSSQNEALEVAKSISVPFRGNLAIKKKYLKETERKRNIRDFIIFFFSGYITEKEAIKRVWNVVNWLEENTIRGQQPSKQMMQKLNEILSQEKSLEIPGFQYKYGLIEDKPNQRNQLEQLLSGADYNEFKDIEAKIIAEEPNPTQNNDIVFNREYFLYFAHGCTAAELSDVVYRFSIATLDPETLHFVSTHIYDDTYQKNFNSIYVQHLTETQKAIEDALTEVLKMGPGAGRQIESKAKTMRIIRPYEEGF